MYNGTVVPLSLEGGQKLNIKLLCTVLPYNLFDLQDQYLSALKPSLS
jgi:hypothetical protein